MNVMKNIIKLLEDRRLEQKDLCDYLKISPQTFTDWKAGRRLSYTKHLDKIAEYFGVSVDYLLGNDTTILLLDFSIVCVLSFFDSICLDLQ